MRTLTVTFRTDYPEVLLSTLKKRETECIFGYDGLHGKTIFGVDNTIVLTKEQFEKQGGEWLGAARKWIQWNCINGSEVIWGSQEVLRKSSNFRVCDVEKIAAEAAYTIYKKTNEQT